jgi:hypothetical protein
MGKAIKLLRTPGFYNYTVINGEMLQVMENYRLTAKAYCFRHLAISY